MIVQTVDLYTFCNAFRNMRPNQFSGPALEALFEYLEGLSDDTGEPYELDVIGICCDFAEYNSVTEAAEDYGWFQSSMDEDEEEEDYEERCKDEALDYLRDRTTVLELSDGGVVIQQF